MADDVFGIVGSVIAGAYQVETVVAEGGFGVVYRAHHVGFRAAVALKCLKIPQRIGSEYQADFLEQFRAEAELLFRLSASIPTVVRPLHVDAVTTADGTFVPFMALEWLEGDTLDAIVARRQAEGRPAFTVRKLARLLTPVARALERAHNFSGPEGPISIVHRDLKPENIMVAKIAGEETVKILDFGIGKAKSVASQVAGRASQTQSRMASFTPAYGAPEQWVPKRYGQTGPWTDVWGLALTMVEVMAARPIIDGDQAAMMGTALDPTRRPTPRTEGIQVEDAVEEVFSRALAVDPRDRQADAGLFWNELLAALGMEAEISAPSRRAPLRDLRSDGGMVQRVETIEAAMPERPAPRFSGTQSIGGDGVRESPTLDAVANDQRGGSGAAWPAIGIQRASGEMHAQRAAIVAAPGTAVGGLPSEPSLASAMEAPSLAGGPDLELASPPPLQPPKPPPSAPAVGASGVREIEASVSGGSSEFALDLAVESPRHRPPSGTMPAASARNAASASSSASSRSSSGWSAVSAPRASGPGAAGPVAATASRTPLPAGRHGAQGLAGRLSLGPAPEKTLAQRLTPGTVLIALSIVVTLADQAYSASTGAVFSLGPLRAGWIAGPLVLAGVVLVVIKLLPGDR